MFLDSVADNVRCQWIWQVSGRLLLLFLLLSANSNPFFISIDEIDKALDLIALGEAGIFFSHF